MMQSPERPTIVRTIIGDSKHEVDSIVCGSTKDNHSVIATYTAAVAVNFTDWIGKTLPWARHELARYALTDNLRCEAVQDHVGMLLNFAFYSDATPEAEHYQHVRGAVFEIRQLFADPKTAGLSGVALCAVLENTSEIFIPDLAKRAKECGCKDFTYTDVHGIADVEHSDAFTKATIAELTMDYGLHDEQIVLKAATLAVNLIRAIYS